MSEERINILDFRDRVGIHFWAILDICKRK